MKPGDLVTCTVPASMSLWKEQAVYASKAVGSFYITDVALVLAISKVKEDARFVAMVLTSRGVFGWIAMDSLKTVAGDQ